ncbi:MAG: c-type cytochrome [Bacteroidia bacterium]|nr:c-type cytochrome [Bacteroidia bacterium]
MKRILLASVIVSLVAVACGGGAEKKTEPAPVLAQPAPNVAEGEKVYKTYCIACHMVDGKGIEGLNPPLAGSDWVAGDKTRLINVVLNGLQGEIEVNGTKYNGVMASHGFLTNAQIAGVLTYVRSNFGNSADAVSVAEVNAIRPQ